ncbi:MAG: c-type cytochrome [Sulfurifustis sp.]
MLHRIHWFLAIVASVLSVSAAAADDFTPELVKHGEQLYVINCSRCHGVHLINPGGYTFDLRQFPLDQRNRFFNSVTKGKGNMPAWGDLLKEEQIKALWAYINTEAPRQR